jgi:phosphate transport system substrate-binding protein
MSEKMIGDRGNLKKLGLVPMPKEKRDAMTKDVMAKKQVNPSDLK